MFQCFILNGVLFLGSLLLVQHVLSPVLRALVIPASPSEEVAAGIDQLADILYKVLWVYPIYTISRVLNIQWYQDIADHAYSFNRGGKKRAVPFLFSRWVKLMAQQLYGCLLVVSYLLQALVLSTLPIIGKPLWIIHACWLYAFYCFEYRWMSDGWKMERRLEFLENNWPYFAGFGLPATLLAMAFPDYVSSGVPAFTYPIFIILATISNPARNEGIPVESAVEGEGEKKGALDDDSPLEGPCRLYPRVPIFRYTQKLNLLVLNCLNVRQRMKNS